MKDKTLQDANELKLLEITKDRNLNRKNTQIIRQRTATQNSAFYAKLEDIHHYRYASKLAESLILSKLDYCNEF